jgi:acetoin utilization protein AcuC
MQYNQPQFIYSEPLLSYKFHDDHPFNQQRLKMTVELLQSWQMLPDSQILAPFQASDSEILLNHDPDFLEAVKRAGSGLPSNNEVYGLGTEDTPIFDQMHEASSLIVGGSLLIGEQVMKGEILHGVNFSGGLHHAFRNKASGFCVYNDAAILIRRLVEKYQAKVLYIDTDAHHGDGVEAAFYDSPDVLTISIHETGRYLFPGTGYTSDRGVGKGYGYAVNIPLDAFTEDESWLNSFQQVMERVLKMFKPDVIVSQHGCDAHYFDPLTHLAVTMLTYRTIPQLIHEWAHRYAEGRWIALGGGGYDIWRVVPRAWSMVWMVMNDIPVKDHPLPQPWLDKWQALSPVEMPPSLFDQPSWFKPIPRREDITEKNRRTVAQILKFFP